MQARGPESEVRMSDLEASTTGRIGVDLYPEQIEVPLAEVETFTMSLGGSARNVAIAQVRGLVAGRALLYPGDVVGAVDAAATIVSQGARPRRESEVC